MASLITGGESFIGSHLADALVERGVDVRLMVVPGADVRNIEHGDLPSRIRWADLLTGDGVAEALEGIDTVYHLAAGTRGYRRRHFVGPNETFARSLVRGVSANGDGVRRIVFLSTQAATRIRSLPRGTFTTEDHDPPPQTYYGMGKRRAEAVLSASGIPTTIIRAPTVFGPRDLKLFGYFASVARGIRPLVGVGGQELSILFVHDLAAGLIAAASSDSAAGRTYYLATAESITWRRFTGLIAAAVGRRAIPLSLPFAALAGLYAVRDVATALGAKPSAMYWNKTRTLRVRRFVCSCERARREIGFGPPTPLPDALSQTVRWYRERGML